MSTLYVASAGCRKTTLMVKKTIEDKRKSLVLTLSNNEFEEIIHKYIKYNKKICENVTLDKYDNLKNYDLNDFEVIYIDEFQEVKDVSIINNFLDKIEINLYFDPRQRTISDFLEFENNIISFEEYIKILEDSYSFKIEKLNECYRMCQKLCDLVSKVYNEPIKSLQQDSDHSGIFFIVDVDDYINKYNPYILKAEKTLYNNAKGLTVDHILIYPTIDMVKFLKGEKDYDKTSVYIALSRAKYSIAFVMDEMMKYM